jgi:hypothetical protein
MATAASPEEQGPTLGNASKRLDHRIAARPRPTAVREAAAKVLVRPAGRLHHAVKGQVYKYSNVAHCNSFLSRENLLTISTNGFYPDRQETRPRLDKSHVCHDVDR